MEKEFLYVLAVAIAQAHGHWIKARWVNRLSIQARLLPGTLSGQEPGLGRWAWRAML